MVSLGGKRAFLGGYDCNDMGCTADRVIFTLKEFFSAPQEAKIKSEKTFQ